MIASVEGKKIAPPMAPLSLRRFTRLTNVFSRQIKNHEHAVALHINVRRMHQSLRVMPAMEAGITDQIWSLNDPLAFNI
jgi:hypothetical protein